jgi:opacity protein-like surface antigen
MPNIYSIMKKLIIIILCLTGSYVLAQNTQQSSAPGPSMRLNVYTTYAFDDNNVDSYYSETSFFEGEVKGGFQYGAGIEYMPTKGIGVELTYLRLASKAPMAYYDNGTQNTTFDLNQNFIFLGANRYFGLNPKANPFAGIQLGMDILNVENPKDGNTNGATRFAWGLKAGLDIEVNEKVTIKLQTGLLSAIQSVGGSLYFGSGGYGGGLTGFSSYYQFSLGGGLVFKLKN